MRIVEKVKYDVELTEEDRQNLQAVDRLILQYCSEMVNGNCEICPFKSFCPSGLEQIFTDNEL